MSSSPTQDHHDIEDICSKEELVTFKTTPLLYPPGNDARIGFKLGSRVSATPYDWIGIFQSGWQDTTHSLASQWVPVNSPKAAKPREYTVTFPSQDMQLIKHAFKSYQFLYINHANQVLGVSKQFMVKEDESWDLDMEVYNTVNTDSQEVLSSFERSELGGKKDAASAKSDSPVFVSSDEEWELASQNALKREELSTSDLSDIEILPSSPSKEPAKLHLGSLIQCDKDELEALLSFSFSSEDNSFESSKCTKHKARNETSKLAREKEGVDDDNNFKTREALECPGAESNGNILIEVQTPKYVRKKKTNSFQKTSLTNEISNVKKEGNHSVNSTVNGDGAKIGNVEVTSKPLQTCHSKTLSRALLEQLKFVDFDEMSDDDDSKNETDDGANQEKLDPKIIEVVSKENKDGVANTRRRLSKEKGEAILLEAKSNKAKRKKKRQAGDSEDPDRSSSKQRNPVENEASVGEKWEDEDQYREKAAILFDEIKEDLEKVTGLNISIQSKERKGKKKTELKLKQPEAQQSQDQDIGLQTEELSGNAKRDLEKEVRHMERKNKRMSKKNEARSDSSANGLICETSPRQKGTKDMADSVPGEELRIIRKKYVHSQKMKNKKRKRMQAKQMTQSHCSFGFIFNGLSNDDQAASKSDTPRSQTHSSLETKDLINNNFLQDTSEKGFPALPSLKKTEVDTQSEIKPVPDLQPESHDPTQGLSKESSEEGLECDKAKKPISPASSFLNTYVPAYLLDVIDALPPASANTEEKSLVEWKRAMMPLVARVTSPSFKAKYKAKFARKQEMGRCKNGKKSLGLNSGIIDRIKTQLMSSEQTNQPAQLKENECTSNPEATVASFSTPPLSDPVRTKELEVKSHVKAAKSTCENGNTLTYAGVVKKHTEEKESTIEICAAQKKQDGSLSKNMENIVTVDTKPPCAPEGRSMDTLHSSIILADTLSSEKSNQFTHPQVCATGAMVVSKQWKRAKDAENERLKEVQDKLRDCSIKQEDGGTHKQEASSEDVQGMQKVFDNGLSLTKENEGKPLLWPMPCLVNIPSSFGSWAPQTALSEQISPSRSSEPAPWPMESNNLPVQVESGLHLRPMARIHSNSSFLSSSSPPKLPKSLKQKSEKHSLEPQMDDDFDQGHQTSVVKSTLNRSTSNIEAKHLTGVPDAPEGQSGDVDKDNRNEEGQESKVTTSSSTEDNVKDVKYRKVTAVKWAGQVKTLIRSNVQIMSLKSKIKATDREMRSLENQVNALREALKGETKKTTKANLKLLKMKIKLKDMKAKLKEYEGIECRHEEQHADNAEITHSHEVAVEEEDLEPPYKKRRMEADGDEAEERLRWVTQREKTEYRAHSQPSVTSNTDITISPKLASSKQSLNHFCPWQRREYHPSPNAYRDEAPEPKTLNTFNPLSCTPRHDSHVFTNGPSLPSSYQARFSNAASSYLLPLGPYVHPRPQLLTPNHAQYYHPSYINNHHPQPRQPPQQQTPPHLPLPLPVHSSPSTALQNGRFYYDSQNPTSSQPISCLLQTPAAPFSTPYIFQKTPRRNSPPHLPLPTPKFVHMSFNKPRHRSREKSSSPHRFHRFPPHSSRHGSRERIHHRVDSPPRPINRDSNADISENSGRRHCLNPYQNSVTSTPNYDGVFSQLPQAQPFPVHIHDSHLCWSSNGALTVNESGRNPASIDSSSSHCSESQGRLNARDTRDSNKPLQMKRNMTDREKEFCTPTLSFTNKTSVTPSMEDTHTPGHESLEEQRKKNINKRYKNEEPMEECGDCQELPKERTPTFYEVENISSLSGRQRHASQNSHFQSSFLRQLFKDEAHFQQQELRMQDENAQLTQQQLQQQLMLPDQLPTYFFAPTEFHKTSIQEPPSLQPSPASSRQSKTYKLFQEDLVSNECSPPMEYIPLYEDCKNVPTFHNEQHHFYQHKPPSQGALPLYNSTASPQIRRYSTSSHQDISESVASFHNPKSTVELNAHGLIGGFKDDCRLTSDNLVEKRLIEASAASHSNRRN